MLAANRDASVTGRENTLDRDNCHPVRVHALFLHITQTRLLHKFQSSYGHGRRRLLLSPPCMIQSMCEHLSVLACRDIHGACAHTQHVCVRKCVCALIIPPECEWQRVNIERFNSFSPQTRPTPPNAAVNEHAMHTYMPPPRSETYTWMHATPCTRTHTQTHTQSHTYRG